MGRAETMTRWKSEESFLDGGYVPAGPEAVLLSLRTVVVRPVVLRHGLVPAGTHNRSLRPVLVRCAGSQVGRLRHLVPQLLVRAPARTATGVVIGLVV